MRKVTLVLLFSLLVFGCKKNEGSTLDTAPASGTGADTAASTSEPNTTPPSTTVAPTTIETQTAGSATAVPSTVTTTDTSTPFDFGPPPTDTAKSVKYDYLVDTLYNWPLDTQKIVIARTGYGAHFFNLANRSKLEAWRKAQGYEKVRSFDVPGAPSRLPNPFINADRVVIVYRKAR